MVEEEAASWWEAVENKRHVKECGRSFRLKRCIGIYRRNAFDRGDMVKMECRHDEILFLISSFITAFQSLKNQNFV